MNYSTFLLYFITTAGQPAFLLGFQLHVHHVMTKPFCQNSRYAGAFARRIYHDENNRRSRPFVLYSELGNSENELSTSQSIDASTDVDDSNINDTIAAAEEISNINTERIINACLLFAAFGFAAHTILDVDHGMTRGWTQKEIMLRLPYDNWRNYENSLVNQPIWTKTSINVIIYLLGDWLSQTVFKKKDILDFDASRTLKNGFIGMCFGPIVAEYYEFSDWILPVEVGINRIYKILMDQTIYLGVKCSIYIAAVGLLNGESVDQVKENVSARIKPVMFTAWKFWPFVHCITYGLIPAQHRILWVNSVDLVWNAILAALSRDEEMIDESIAIEQNEALVADSNNSTGVEHTTIRFDEQIGHVSKSMNSNVLFTDSIKGSGTKQIFVEEKGEITSV
eukprot:CAMPEP_0196808752 /NCGR_PEP_ID=MMETSP1362-20130617/8742_1 /TAXON_ID=163516 /ORGANISM="Leptocylindrus danicus, Strain CCMP1856" /LENGTH=394 /DNA_ID=CAMNT_0042183205 /DNA_START=229 /DNA_END=1410 /DNA_ORIENTATION=+